MDIGSTAGYPSIKTTLTEANEKLPNKSRCRIVFKNEYQQPSGSFKLRGMGHLIAVSIDKARELKMDKIQIFSSSGGNAGLAAAFASHYYNLPCTVVLPVVSKPIVIENLRKLGAEVVVFGNHWGEADAHLRDDIIANLPPSVYPVYCHPFDNLLLWDGHGKMIDEIVTEKQLSQSELTKVKGIVCSAGGGGLYNGIVTGLQRNPTLSNVPVLVVETAQAPTFSTSVKAGKVIKLDSVNTIATTLASPYISEKSLLNYNSHATRVQVIDDLEAVKGTIDYYDHFGTLVEPACGATMCMAFENLKLLEYFGDLAEDDIIIFIVCGGSGISTDTIHEYRKLIL